MIENKKLILQFFMPASVVFFILVQTGPAMALNSNFTQQILPLDCIFTVENTGTGELHYVTPYTCGVALPSSGSSSSQSQGSDSSVQTGETFTPSGYGQSRVTEPGSNSTTSGSLVYSLPQWSPIASITSPKSPSQSKETGSTNQTIVIAAVGSFLVLLFIIAFVVI